MRTSSLATALLAKEIVQDVVPLGYPTPGYQPEKGQQHEGPQGGYQDRPDVYTRYPRAAEDPDDESSDKSAKHTYEDRCQEAARVLSRHH